MYNKIKIGCNNNYNHSKVKTFYLFKISFNNSIAGLSSLF